MKAKKPVLTYFFILICLAVFLFEIYYQFIYGEEKLLEIFYTYGFSLKNLLERPWTSITSIFFHGGAEHFVLNMIALFFFGRIVELELGKKKFLILFFISSFFGDIAIILSIFLGIGSPLIPTIGASAAVFGLLGTAMLIKPLEFVMYPYLIPIPLILVALLYTLYNIGAFLMVITTGEATTISYSSHIGGMAFGMFFGFKQEGSRRGLIILLLLLILLVATPFIWFIYENLELFNYVNIITNIVR